MQQVGVIMLGQFIEPQLRTALISSAKLHRPWLEFDPDEFARNYNRQPFLLKHRLTEHPLFKLQPLIRLCYRLPSPQVHCRAAVVPENAEFDSSLERFNDGMTLDAAIKGLEHGQAYIAIYNPEFDDQYRDAIEEFIGEIALRADPLERGLNWYSTYIFLSTQHAVTPYHMDREMNFLLQIEGAKTVRLWDPMDEEVMTSAQRDMLLSSLGEPRPPYNSAIERKAMVFRLEPGAGVHHPYIAPHLVHTNSELSISLAITFRTNQSDIWRDAHCMNQHLRKLGLHPSAVHQSGWLDTVKALSIRTLRRVKRIGVNPSQD